MKKTVYLLIILLCAKIAIAQTENEKLLMSDSAGISLENALKNHALKYGFDLSSIPDSNVKQYDRLSALLLKRNLLIEKFNKEAAKKNWNTKTDSLIAANKTEFIGTGNISLGLSDNQGMISVQYAFLFSNYRRFDFGIGSGIEYLNRNDGLVQVIQSPVFITNKYFVSKGTFLNLDYGLTIPLSANYKNQKDETVELTENELKLSYFLNFGIGFMTKKENYFEINFRNNSLGMPDPLNQRVWMFGIKYGF